MPLLAFTAEGRRLGAWFMPAQEWDQLKTNYRDFGLRSACCGKPVIPVTSKTGWYFFRHAPGTACAIHESADHLVAKIVVARAAEALGLEVTTEARGPDDRWRADVLVRHPFKGWCVAIEIQLSHCPIDEIEARQMRYAADGVRGAWLTGFMPADHEASRDLPLFRLETRRGGRVEPFVACKDRNGLARTTDLAEFTRLLLTGGIEFAGPPAYATKLSVVGASATCWRCHHDLLMVVGFANVPSPVLAPNGFLPAKDLGKLPDLLEGYRSAIPTLLRVIPELTVLRRPRRPGSMSELQAFCPWDDAPQGLHRIAPELLTPGRQRCWTLDGEPWTPGEQGRPRWVIRTTSATGRSARSSEDSRDFHRRLLQGARIE
ncbi:competence protein CoiA family protein [Arenibaculum pallidiluteum]|uniref:competence protein CoiA family protein n=1 Tax=Arenibaculum pallidiluteum TaxID=2812559 RepID=UPI001A978C95|nr:competence protein CoiA family protein [Arenibaculum pallidiluteum]